MRMRLSEIASCLNIPDQFQECEILSARTDHRQCGPGDIFVCIEGERVDGHNYAPAAVKNGAVAILAQKELADIDVPVLKVENSIKALDILARNFREKSRAKVIGITGSAGKTTLKDTLVNILSEKGRVAFTEKNHNNQIGLPCAILSADGDEDWWVMEIGISHDGDMQELGEILKPDFAIILNVAPGHTEGLGGKGVAWHKSRIFEYLMPGGIALASADYPDLVQECDKFPFNINYFSIKKQDKPWHLLENRQKGQYLFQLPKERLCCHTPFLGEFGAETALAAIAAADILGLDAECIQRGFAKSGMPEQRFSCKNIGGWTVINDTYNANPLSMRRMIKAAKEEAEGKNLILVLGEMGELGEEADKQHYELGRICADCKPNAIFWHGGHEREITKGLKEGAYDLGKLFPIDEVEDFNSRWSDIYNDSSADPSRNVILFKGSRFNKMERFLEAFEKLLQKKQGEKDVL